MHLAEQFLFRQSLGQVVSSRLAREAGIVVRVDMQMLYFFWRVKFLQKPSSSRSPTRHVEYLHYSQGSLDSFSDPHFRVDFSQLYCAASQFSAFREYLLRSQDIRLLAVWRQIGCMNGHRFVALVELGDHRREFG